VEGFFLREFITYDHRRILIIIEKNISKTRRQGFKLNGGLRWFSNSSRGSVSVGFSSFSSMKN
jgi:hypothetical protein